MKKKSLLNRWLVFTTLVISVIALTEQMACADGKYFPEQAYKIPPKIPSQKAILVYKDGIEKLIIESAMEGQGREFGWIIPLPSKPTDFAEVSPGLVKTLNLTIRPEITHDLTSSLEGLYTVTIFVTAWFLLAVLLKKRTLFLSIIFLAIALFISILTPVMRGTLGISIDVPGVRVLDVEDVGSYGLAVLEAETAEALNQWLGGNGFQGLSDKDRVIVSDYIEQNWCFVAAKLRREESGYSEPHPLAMSFVAEEPIYPMRLTSTVGNDVYLELFVIAQKKAACRNLVLEHSDRYSFSKKANLNYFSKDVEDVLPGFIGKTYRQKIGHPEVFKCMWDGCVLSKLCGTLAPAEMNKDIVIALKSGGSFRKHYFSQRGANGTSLMVCLTTWSILLLVLYLVFQNKIKGENGREFALLRIALPIVLLSLILGGITYALLPKTEVETGHKHFRIFYRMWLHELEVFTEQFVEDNKGLQEMDIAEIKTRFQEGLKSWEGSIKDVNIDEGDSPGNYVIFEDERGVVFRYFDMEGFPFDFVLRLKPNRLDK